MKDGISMGRAELYEIGADVCDIRRVGLIKHRLTSNERGVLYEGRKSKCLDEMRRLRVEEVSRRTFGGII